MNVSITQTAPDPPKGYGVLSSVRRLWPVVLLTALLAVAAGMVTALGHRDAYRADSEMLIVPLSQDNQVYFGTGMLRDSGDPGLTAANAALVLHSADIGKAAAERLGGAMTTQWVLAHVEVRPTPETNVLQVRATAGSQDAALRLTDAYLTAMTDVRWKLVSSDVKRRIAVLTARPATDNAQIAALQQTLRAGTDPTVQVTQRASTAAVVSHSPTALVIALSLLGGVFMGSLIAFGIDRLAGRIQDAADARRETGIRVWGSVPRLPRALRRAGPVTPSQLPPAAAGQFRELANLLAHTVQERGTVALVSPTEGDGRTTAAIALASELACRGRRVTLVLLSTELGGAARTDLRAANVDLIEAGAVPIAKTLARIRPQADLVLVDGPAMERGGDLVALLEPADFIVVTRAGHTPRRKAADARDLLSAMAIQPRGMIFLGARQADVRRRGSRHGDPQESPDVIVARADDLTKPWDARVSS